MKSIAYCGCGNLSLDGLNFSRAEGAADSHTLVCGACGAVSADFEFIPRSEAAKYERALRCLQLGPDTLTQRGLEVVLGALYGPKEGR